MQGSYRALASRRDGILLGSGVASRMGANVDDVVVRRLAARARSCSLKVVGIFDCGIPPVDNTRVYVTLRNAQTLLGKPGHRRPHRGAPRRTPTRAPAVTADRRAHVRLRRRELAGDERQLPRASSRMQNTIISFVVGAILAVGGFGILAIQIMIVLQKTRDIAILRSVGFRRERHPRAPSSCRARSSRSSARRVGDVVGHYVLVALSHLKTHQEGLVKSETFLVYDDPRFYWYGVGLRARRRPASPASSPRCAARASSPSTCCEGRSVTRSTCARERARPIGAASPWPARARRCSRRAASCASSARR